MRSCRQGDPVAAYLFILVLEILLNRIRRLVKGLNLGSAEIVALAYADDLTIFVLNSKELEKAMCLIENFKAATGLEVNKEKSEILELGTSSRLHGVPTKHTVKITGVHFCLDKSKMLKKKWEENLNPVNTLLRSWKQRHVTLIGRANILKAQVLPIISFLGTTLDFPESYEKRLVRECFLFLWAGNSKKERLSLCYKDFNQGGLAVPHFKSRLSVI
jgi:hypothetical protein